MRKGLTIFLIVIALLALGVAFLQSPSFHRLARAKLIEKAQAMGWEIAVEKSEGFFPLSFTWKGVQLSGNGTALSIDRLDAEIAPLSLFQKELRVTYLDMGHVNAALYESPKMGSGSSIHLEAIEIETLCFDGLCLENVEGSFESTKTKWRAKGSFSWKGGPFAFDVAMKGDNGRIAIESPLGTTTLQISPTKEGTLITGEGFRLDLSLPHFSLVVGSLEAKGEIDLQNGIDLDFSMENLHDLPFDLYGSAQGKLTGTFQKGLELQGSGANLYWGPLFCEALSFRMDSTKRVDLQAAHFTWHTLALETASLQAQKEDVHWNFLLDAIGRWHHPLQLQCQGQIDRNGNGSLAICTGNFYNHPFSLQNPLPFSPSSFGPLLLAFDQGELQATWQKPSFDLTLTHFPLDLLSLNPLEVPINGEVSSSLHVEEAKDLLTGHFDAEISGFEAGTLQLAGSVTGNLNTDLLTLAGKLGWKTKELIGLELSLPMHLLSSLQLELLWHAPLQGRLTYLGKIEELLDFADLGMHHVSGDLQCDLTLQGTLSSPMLHGHCTLIDGTYDNYLTGVKLTDLTLQAEGKGDRIAITLTATDLPTQGRFEGSGEIAIDIEEKLPFSFEGKLHDFAITQIDLVSSKAEGTLFLTGNWEGAKLEGAIDLLHTELQIPSHVPQPLPTLTVVYRHATKPPPTPPTPSRFAYPIDLNLSLQTPGGVGINGRGLTSAWNGSLHLGGTPSSLLAEGKLELIEGEFVFAGKSFKLTDGSLSFRGRPNEVPNLNLGGTLEVKNVEISVRLKGPLNRPQVSLQSNPPLPMSSIVSYLLFGQELSEINSFQALQLVSTIASFAGESPDVMEQTRKALGVDRLEIVSLPGPENEAELTNSVAIQVGKYVGESVLISYTQGAEFAAGNISIELELPKGLTIVLENDQLMEQGRFTLKWNYNY